MKRLEQLKLIDEQYQYKTALYKQAEINEDDIWNALSLVGIKKNSEPKDIINFLSPTILSFIVNSILGTKFLGVGLDLILRLLKVDFAQLLESLISNIKEMSEQNHITKDKIDSTIDSTIDQHLPVEKTISSHRSEKQNLRIIKLAYIHNYEQINKKANLIKLQAGASTLAGTTNNFLKVLFKKIFSIILFSGVMGGIATYVGSSAGLPGFDSHTQKYISKQKKFTVNPNYKDIVLPYDYPWTEDINNNVDTIKNMLKSWAKEIYVGVTDQDLDKSEMLEAFATIIKNHNLASTANNVISIPKDFRSKKEVVDYFIDNVAKYSNLPDKIKEAPAISQKSNHIPSALNSSDVSKIREIKLKALNILHRFENADFSKLEKNVIKKKIEEAIDKISRIPEEQACNLQNISYMQKAKKDLSEMEFNPFASNQSQELANQLSPIIEEYLKVCKTN